MPANPLKYRLLVPDGSWSRRQTPHASAKNFAAFERSGHQEPISKVAYAVHVKALRKEGSTHHENSIGS